MKTTPKIRKRPLIGDIVEIETPKGYAYAWYTHKHTSPPRWGEFIQVFRGLCPERQQDLSKVTSQPVQYSTFFPLAAAINVCDIRIIDDMPIPKDMAVFPVFKEITYSFDGKTVVYLGTWDGQTSKKLECLEPKHLDLPRLQIINDTVLIDYILSGRSNADEVPVAKK